MTDHRRNEWLAAATAAMMIAGAIATVGASASDEARVDAYEARIGAIERQVDSLSAVIDLQGAAIETLERELRDVVTPATPAPLPSSYIGRSRR